jgi:hypothetical protein
MVCDSIDFDFSDYHPHGRPGRFALDTPLCSGLGRTSPATALRQARPALQGLDLTPTLHHTACAFTQHAARRVLDTTRDWLQNSPSPEQTR